MIRRGLFAGAVAAAVIVTGVVNSAVAEAKSSPNVVGQKYSDAKSALSGAGFTPVVSTTVGDQLSWPNCVVANQRDRSLPAPPNSSGSATNETLVSLNCDAAVASATSAGNSLGSPEGRAAAAAAQKAAAGG